jgi:hypothetical protein
MHPGTDLLARLAMALTHIFLKKRLSRYPLQTICRFFHTHHSGAPLDNTRLAVNFSTAVETAFRVSVVSMIGLELQGSSEGE